MTSFQRTAFASAILSASLLSACGGSSSSSSSSDEHDHDTGQRLLFTEASSTDLTVYDLEDDEFELVGSAAATGGYLVLADDGLTAAVVTDSTVQFVHSGLEAHDEDEESEEESEEEHVDASLISAAQIDQSISDLLMTNNHYSFVNTDGDTSFYVAADLAESTVTSETFSVEGLTQTFPALILDEDHELIAAFDGTNVLVYEGDQLLNSYSCSDPDDATQNGGLALMSCGEGVRYLLVEEDETSGDAEVHSSTVLDGVELEGVQVAGDYILAYSSEAVYLVSANVDQVKTEVQDITLNDQSVCAAALDNDAEALLVVRDDATGEVIDLTETLSTVSLTLTEADAEFSCDDVKVLAGEAAFAILDNSSGHMYLADSHDGAAYHIHTTVELDAGIEIDDAVLMLEKEVSEHDHEE